MKRFLLIIFTTFSLVSIAQQNDCFTSNPFCSDQSYTFPNATGSTASNSPDYGCLGSWPNPIWYYMEIGTSGTIQINIEQTQNADGSGTQLDVDFAMWGPFSDVTSGCNQIMSGNLSPLQCSYSGSYQETIGIGLPGGMYSGASTPPAAVAGEIYIVILTNFSGSPGYISFNQTGGAGSADCSIVDPCVINNLTGTVSACNTATQSYTVNGTVTVSNPPATGNLVVRACDGTQVVIASAPFNAASYNYNITGLDANGLPCDVTAEFTDDACFQVLNYTAPTCPVPCSFTSINGNIGACEPGSVFDLTGTLQFVSPPTTGQLIVQDCNGNSQTFNPPFVSPLNIAINNIPADGQSCNVTATFTANPACTISLNYTNPISCNCDADIGTFTAITDGTAVNSTNYILCYGNVIGLQANGDYTPAAPANNPPLAEGYQPGISWLVYTCPPTIGLVPNATTGIPDDPCLLGIINSTDLIDLNDQSWMDNYPAGTFTGNTVYFVPITMYNTTAGYYSYVNTSMPCYETGAPIAIQYLPEITQTTVADCQNGTVSVTVQGGAPAVNGSNFTASGLTPATASFTSPSVANGGTFVVNGLQDGDNYSFQIADQYGCPITITGTFTGVSPSDFTYPQAAYCKDAANPSPTITGTTGGTFTGSAGLVINGTTGVINIASTPAGTYTVTYASPGAPCNSSTPFTITINPLPVVTAPNVAVCLGAVANLTASGADTYSWSPATGLSATTGASVSATLTANQTYTITGTNTTTGCVGTGTVTVTVNPVPAPVISGPTTYCQGATATLQTTVPYTTYNWSTGQTTPTIQVTQANSPVTVTVTNAQGCSAISAQHVITELPVITTSSTVEICQGQTATIHGVARTTAGLYTRTTPSTNGCDSISNVTLVVHPLPVINAGANQTVCDGTPVTLNATGAPTIVWNPAATNGVSFTQAVGTVTYTATGTDVNGCVSTGNVTITVNPMPVPVISGDLEYCAGTSATIQTTLPYATYSWSSGQTSATAQVTQANNPITVTVTTAQGCTATSPQYVVTENSIVTTNSTIEICQGQSATIHGVPRTAAGTYTNTVPSAIGCDSVSNITLVVHPLPVINPGTNQTVCDGTPVTLNATGAPTIVWNPTATNGVAFTQAVGAVTYTATGTDQYGCESTGTVTITVNPMPVPVISGDLEYCAGTTATVQTTQSFSSYTWSSGQTSPTAQVTQANNPITVTVTNIQGCSATSPQYVVTEKSIITTNTSVEICQGQSATIHGIARTTAGVYATTVTSLNGCDSTSNVTLVVHPLPVMNAGLNQQVCAGESVTLNASGAQTIVWDNSVSNGVAFTPAVGTVTYTATGTDQYGCENTAQVQVTVNPLPVITQQPDLTYCRGAATNLISFTSTIPNTTYQWTSSNAAIGLSTNGSGNITSFTAANTTSSPITATITVTPTSPNACVGPTMSFTITVMPAPTATISSSAQVCIGGTSPVVTFTGGVGTAPYTISYNINGGATQTITTTGSTATINAPTTTSGLFVYNLVSVQETANSCTSTVFGSVTITVYDLPVIVASNDVAICVGGSTPITASGAGAVGTYSWDNGLGAGQNKTVSPTVTTTYVVSGTDNHGCVNTDNVVVTVNTPNGVNAGPDQVICKGESVVLTATSSDPASTFQWTNSVQNGVSFTPGQSSSYTVSATDVNGCISNDIVDVTLNSLPVIDAGTNIVGCEGDQFTFTGSGAGAGGSYAWSNGIQNGVPYTVSAGNQMFYVTGTDANGCEGIDSLSAKIQAFPVISFYAEQEQACAPVAATFYNTTQYDGATSCVWNFDDGTTVLGCGPVSHVFTYPGSYGASLQVTSVNAGCVSTLYQDAMVIADAVPQAHFTPNPQIGTQVNNQISFVNGSYGATSYYWEFGDGVGTSTEVNPVYTYSEEPNWYNVMLIATSQGGCIDTAYAYVTIQEELIFYVPNTFTPDKDQYNEVFKPIFTYGYDPFTYSLYIFNRWGEMIFESHDVNVGWDGTYGEGGTISQDGTYVWKIDVKTTMNDERKTFTGHVNLLR